MRTRLPRSEGRGSQDSRNLAHAFHIKSLLQDKEYPLPFAVKPSCGIEKDVWIKGRVTNWDIKEDATSCWAFCIAKYPAAKYFEYCTENHPWRGPGTPAYNPAENPDGLDLRKACLCKLSNEGGGPNPGGSVSGDLTCGGFYLGRLLNDETSTNPSCDYAGGDRCHFEWDDGTEVRAEVLARGLKYEFDPAGSDKTSFKCTYMDGDRGIV